MKDEGRNRSVALAGRGIGKIGKSVMSVMGIDPRGQAGRFAQKARDGKMSVGIFHRLREFDVGIAGRFRHIENHVVAVRFKSFQPCRIGLLFRKGPDRLDASDKCDRQMRRPRGCQQGFAISQHRLERMRLRLGLTRLMKPRQNEKRLLALPFVAEKLDDGHAGVTLGWKVW